MNSNSSPVLKYNITMRYKHCRIPQQAHGHKVHMSLVLYNTVISVS